MKHTERGGQPASEFLGRDMGAPMEVIVEGAGEGRVSGSTRWLVTVWLEDTRAAVLKTVLELFPDQTARPQASVDTPTA